MSINNKTKNVKLSTDLVDSIHKRNPDAPIGATLLEIYTEYEYLETVARRVACVKENEPIKISEAIEKFFSTTLDEVERLRKSSIEMETMIKGLNMFFTKIK